MLAGLLDGGPGGLLAVRGGHVASADSGAILAPTGFTAAGLLAPRALRALGHPVPPFLARAGPPS